jgi:REP element-mobilizing transposase RayT
MPRRPRIHAPGAFYHVTLRGNHRKPVFFCDADHERLNDIVARALDRCQARLHAYCWMPNHLHMLLQVADMPLGRVVLRIASSYARSVQARLGTTGHLFERRHHAVLVDADRYLLTLLQYIHLNPVRAGLARNAADYRWSSHHDYVRTRHEPWVTTDFALAMLGGDYQTAIARYRRLIGAMRERGQAASPLADLHPSDERVLGDDRFLANLALPKESTRPGLTLDVLILEAGARFGLAPADLLSVSRDRRLSRARAWIAHTAVVQRVATTAQVARALHRDESTIRELVERHFPCQGSQQ